MIGKLSPYASRRQFIASSAITALVTLPGRCFASPDEDLVVKTRDAASGAKIVVEKLRGNISAITGAGGNITVLAGRDGKVMIDSGLVGSRQGLADALASVGPEPVKYLINTHWHFDHTDGNEWVHAAGTSILAHENTRKHMSSATRVESWNHTFPPSPNSALPAEVFAKARTLHLNGITMELEYYPPSHTDSDISVYFASADVFVTGDTWWNGRYPFIDYSTGGSIDGMIRAAESNLAKVSSNTVIIPGHGPVGNRSQLAEYRDVLASIRAKVAGLKKQGKSLDEVIAAKPSTEFDPKWGARMNPPDFIRLVYAGV